MGNTMKKITLILLILSITCSLYSANPIYKSLAEAIVSGGKFESKYFSRESAEALAEKTAAKACRKECLKLCEKYPEARAIIMNNSDEFVLLSKRFGDDALKQEIANPGILKFGESVFGTDGVRLLAKERPETFFNLTKYFKRKPEQTASYLGIYKVAEKFTTPKNIVATGLGFGLFKMCYDGGVSVKEFASGISNTVDKIADKYPAVALFTIFSTVLIFILVFFGVAKRLFMKLFSLLFFTARRFCSEVHKKLGGGKTIGIGNVKSEK